MESRLPQGLGTPSAICSSEPTYDALPASEVVRSRCVDFTKPLPGTWLQDARVDKKVDLERCPFLSSAFACKWLGLPWAESAMRLRFSPRDCRLEPFCAHALVDFLAGGRQIVFTGDSHGRQVLSQLMCRLWQSARSSILNVTGRCGKNPQVDQCTGFQQWRQTRILCGPLHCTSDATAHPGRLQSGPQHGTSMHLVNGGGLHLWELPLGYAAASALQMRTYYTTLLPLLVNEFNLTTDDVIVVNDAAAHRSQDAEGLRAAAASLVEYSRRHDAPRLVWLDYQAPHFGKRSDGEFWSKPAPTCAHQSGTHESGGIAPAYLRQGMSGACRPHTCHARGIGNVAVPVLSGGGVPVLYSFHATRLVHTAHPAIAQTNYSRWKQPDCHHVCTASGPDELRVTLLYNMLVAVPNATNRSMLRRVSARVNAYYHHGAQHQEVYQHDAHHGTSHARAAPAKPKGNTNRTVHKCALISDPVRRKRAASSGSCVP